MSGNTWEEIEQAGNDQRHELHLCGDTVSERLKSRDLKLPDELFMLSALNYLEISDTCLTSVPDELKKLNNLINLALHRNNVNHVTDAINELPKLKFLDLSFNKLTTFLQTITLEAIHTLNIANNQITSFADLSNAKSLSILHVEHNLLERLPTGLDASTSLSEIYAAGNLLGEIPNEIKDVVSLKVFDVSENKLKTVPGELTQCQRLKTLKLEGNPLSDKRLKKMTSQCNTKAILEYISKQAGSGGGGGKKGKKKKGAKEKQNDEELDDEDVRKIYVIPNTNEEQVVAMDTSVREVRPYICCTVIKNLDLREPSVFKDFLALQVGLFGDLVYNSHCFEYT